MKKFVLSLLIGLAALSAFGQEKGPKVNQRFFDANIREYVYRLNLTDQQRDAFIPIYKRYSEEMHAAMAEKKLPKGRPATSEEAASLAKARIERQQLAQSIRMKYIDEFAAVLEPDQMNRLFKVESQIQEKLKNKKNGKGHGPRNNGNRDR